MTVYIKMLLFAFYTIKIEIVKLTSQHFDFQSVILSYFHIVLLTYGFPER